MAGTADTSIALDRGRAVTPPSQPNLRDDAPLVEAARAGDRAAFARLYQRYARVVHGILLARVPPGDVDDLVQDVFLRALAQLRTLRHASLFAAWLGAIARNRARDYHRGAARHVLLDELPAAASQRHADAAHAALQALCRLPETYREILILRLVEGMTGPEIAARTGLTPGSVRVNLHRGMKVLRERLGR